MSGSNLLKTKINLDAEIIDLINAANEQILIYSPYIKIDALKSILSGKNARTSVTIITTWKKSDVAFGSTDLDVYPFCKENRFQLRINNNIHLKCIAVDGMKKAYIGSANITNAGLAIGGNYNYEIGAIKEDLTVRDKFYLHELINNSFEVDNDYYDDILNEAKYLEKPNIEESFKAKKELKKDFLLTSLPQCKSPKMFYEYYLGINKDTDSDDYLCYLNDLSNYEIPPGLDETELKKQLKTKFLEHPFSKKMFQFIGDDHLNFGAVTKWLHNIVETVPTPKRREIKDIQINLYEFINELSDNYVIEVPGKRSQVIKKL